MRRAERHYHLPAQVALYHGLIPKSFDPRE